MIKKKVAFHTLGCKLNFTETSTIARSLNSDEFERIPFNEKADIYVINTCTVTEAADKKCRQLIGKTSRQNPDSLIIVVGCYAQLKPGEITNIPGVDLVLGTYEKFDLINYLKRIEKSSVPEVHSCDTIDSPGFYSSFSLGDRTRSFLKVQDGCDYLCSYCTVPLARGKNRNISIEKCIEQATQIASSGIKEIVITGVNIGDFGKTTGETFYGLLEGLLKVDRIERYRISSVEPNLLSDEIIDLVASEKKLMPHFHIPLQSGCNRILGKMKRRYNREVFQGRVSRIKTVIPYAGIGADVIVGFPGETDFDFTETRTFLESCDLSYLHVFAFSPRQDTPAAKMDNRVTDVIKSERSKILHRLSEKRRIEFNRKCTGMSFNILWESVDKEGFISGFTENYIRVKAIMGPSWKGKISAIKLPEMDESGNFSLEPSSKNCE